MNRPRLVWILTVLSLFAAASPTSAQTFSADARKIGMGGVGDNDNIAASMVPSAQPYTVILLPFGLIQLYSDRNLFNPSNSQFNPVQSIEEASNPLAFTTGRASSPAEQLFISDLVNGRLNRDISTYRGFLLPSTLTAQGLASPGFGMTFKVAHTANDGFQGFYIGAGPYFSFDTTLGVDPKLTDILSSPTAKYYPNSAFQLQDSSAVQLAMDVIFGYRARFAFPGASAPESARDGIYVAFNYRYLIGFEYLQPDVTVRFDTDPQGLVTIKPTTTPANINDLQASSGTGRAVDVGVEVVRGPWQVGGGVSGIGNQIDWTNLTMKQFTLTSLVQGASFVQQTLPTSLTDVIVKLPVVTSGDLGYDAGNWAFATTVSHGYNGNSFHGGLERRLGALALRGGARYSRQHWDPTGGVGIGGKVALDVAVYGTHANLESKQEMAVAVSLRINHGS